MAHQLCDLTSAVEADSSTGRLWAVELRHLLGQAIHLHEIRDTLTADSFTRRRRRIENAVDRLVVRTFLPDQPDTANASAIFTSPLTTARKQRENLFQALRSAAGPSSPLHAAGMLT